jgi:hypothetical protein
VIPFPVFSATGYSTTSKDAHVSLISQKYGELIPGANPTITSYSASAVKIYNATSSIARILDKKYFFSYVKMLKPTYNTGVVAVPL